ncbi:SDR family oxidoreductase [Taibaiella koreensis]|uniref:SDR family oxidoreductase n=1 Tax=Taibaiella koreensis TaxID=1268548 RepID=UPI0019696C37|nr:SDR family oxidoreductase [Taibaiella koreensis]
MESINHRSGSMEGKRVMILGGSTGIGLATAKAAAAAGAAVCIVSGNPQRMAAALQQLPEDTEGHVVNLSETAQIRDFFASSGRFDHMVYSAGEPLSLSSIAETDIEQARNFFNIRYWGAFAAVKYAAPQIRTGGSVNLTGGTAAQRPGSGWSIAASICGAMEGLTRALAAELAPIRVNSVVPAVIQTGLWRDMPEADREALYQSVAESYLVRRAGQAEDVAQAHLYLMQQSFTTGQNLVVDGGALLV